MYVLAMTSTSPGTLRTSSPPSSGSKRAASHLVSHPEDNTDSEIELFPTKPRKHFKRQKVPRPEDDEHDGGSDNDSSSDSSLRHSSASAWRRDSLRTGVESTSGPHRL
jgi:hypothetical protein